MIEYEEIVLDNADPDADAAALNELAALGWTVTGTYSGDRVILEREKPVLTPRPSRGILRAIDEPRSAA